MVAGFRYLYFKFDTSLSSITNFSLFQSSGSGSECSTQTQKSVKSKGVQKSDNNTGSNDEDDNGSIGLNISDGSDDGNGTQVLWVHELIGGSCVVYNRHLISFSMFFRRPTCSFKADIGYF